MTYEELLGVMEESEHNNLLASYQAGDFQKAQVTRMAGLEERPNFDAIQTFMGMPPKDQDDSMLLIADPPEAHDE